MRCGMGFVRFLQPKVTLCIAGHSRLAKIRLTQHPFPEMDR